LSWGRRKGRLPLPSTAKNDRGPLEGRSQNPSDSRQIAPRHPQLNIGPRATDKGAKGVNLILLSCATQPITESAALPGRLGGRFSSSPMPMPRAWAGCRCPRPWAEGPTSGERRALGQRRGDGSWAAVITRSRGGARRLPLSHRVDSVARGIESLGRRIDEQPTGAVEMRLRNVEPPWALVVSQLRELDRAGVRPGVPTRSATRLAIRPS
jgi:hypothetical protein